MTGNAENSGAVSTHYNPQTIEGIQSELSKAEHELNAANIDADLKQEALRHVQSAKADPSPTKISKAIDVLGKVESLATKAVGAGTAIGTIATTLGRAAGLM